MSVRSPSRRQSVYVISRHPGLLTTMEQLLAKSGFKVMPLRWDHLHHNGTSQRGKHIGPRSDLSSTSVFVVDASSIDLRTEALMELIRTEYPGAKPLIVKESAKDEVVFPFLRMGAKGIVRFEEAERDLANAVKVVAEGDFWLQRKQLARFVEWLLSSPSFRNSFKSPGQLSRREREVLTLILRGQSNKEIGSALNISERTVKFHVSHLLQKLGANRRSDLIARQYQLWSANA